MVDSYKINSAREQKKHSEENTRKKTYEKKNQPYSNRADSKGFAENNEKKRAAPNKKIEQSHRKNKTEKTVATAKKERLIQMENLFEENRFLKEELVSLVFFLVNGKIHFN